jgi:hypothetical protein
MVVTNHRKHKVLVDERKMLNHAHLEDPWWAFSFGSSIVQRLPKID